MPPTVDSGLVADLYAVAATKFVLFLYCWGLRKKSSQVHVLWEDHRNDLFINGFGEHLAILLGADFSDMLDAGILMSAGGSKLAWWLDPTGAVNVSLLILDQGRALTAKTHRSPLVLSCCGHARSTRDLSCLVENRRRTTSCIDHLQGYDLQRGD